MTQQERILSLAQEQIQIVGTSGARFGKTYKAAFELAIRFTLENLWIPVDEALPPKRKTTKGEELEESIPVFVRDNEGNYTSAWYSFYGKYWYMAYGEAFLKQSIYSKVTHWMPIPPLKILNNAIQGEVSHIWKDGSGRLIGDYERNIALEKYKKGGEK